MKKCIACKEEKVESKEFPEDGYRGDWDVYIYGATCKSCLGLKRYKLCSECGENREYSTFPLNKHGVMSIRCCYCMVKRTEETYLDMIVLGVHE